MDAEGFEITATQLILDTGKYGYKTMIERSGGSKRDLSDFIKQYQGRLVLPTIPDDVLAEADAACKSPLHLILNQLPGLIALHTLLAKTLPPEYERLAANTDAKQQELDKATAKLDETTSQLEQAQANLADVQAELASIYGEIRTD